MTDIKSLLTNCTYLEDESLHLMGIKFYGSPWQPRFSHSAFNLTRGPELRSVWDQIPSDTEVLITHRQGNSNGNFMEKYKIQYPRLEMS